MFIETTLQKSLDEVRSKFEEAVKKHNFSILHFYHFSEALRDKGYPITGDLYIFDICSPKYAQATLEKCCRLGAMIPCRISIFSDGNEVRVTALDPSVVYGMLRDSDPKLAEELKPIMDDVREVLKGIMDDLN